MTDSGRMMSDPFASRLRSHATEKSLEDRPHRHRRPLTVVSPLHYTASYAYPLLVWLHHGGHNELQVEQVLPHISIRNYVAVGVRGNQATDVRGWGFDWSNGKSSVASAREAVIEAVEHVQDHMNIHPERIVIAGYGSGATMACRIALMEPDRFGCVAMMGGEFPSRQSVMREYHRLRQRRLPVLWQQAINGVDDDPDRLKRGILAAESIRARVEIRQYRGDDVMNAVALRDMDQWCFDTIIQPRPESTADHSTMRPDEGLSPIDFSAN
ncbi:phospholipase [Rhodopirellula sp. JC740]|uniref:Phospholipase n=1 Tax=Rhodopirellula halodulae TaxID=2894198 RepID=A0ABS8NM74_9BACT|nr:alpha/beta hydrolase-fold protein [Rhodopirellula sp. JC740]MCC9644627.1 phospholipase [Rhodopirellula sp. JC740]